MIRHVSWVQSRLWSHPNTFYQGSLSYCSGGMTDRVVLARKRQRAASSGVTHTFCQAWVLAYSIQKDTHQCRSPILVPRASFRNSTMSTSNHFLTVTIQTDSHGSDMNSSWFDWNTAIYLTTHFITGHTTNSGQRTTLKAVKPWMTSG